MINNLYPPPSVGLVAYVLNVALNSDAVGEDIHVGLLGDVGELKLT